MGFFKRSAEGNERGGGGGRRRGKRGAVGTKRRNLKAVTAGVGNAKRAKFGGKVSRREAAAAGDDEEIPSSSESDEEKMADGEAAGELLADAGDDDDDMAPPAEEVEEEYAEEDSHTLAHRAAKRLLDSVKQNEHDDEQEDEEEEETASLSMAARLRLLAQSKMGKMHRPVAESTRFAAATLQDAGVLSHRSHRLAPTGLCFSANAHFLVSCCSKDGSVAKYDLAKGCRVGKLPAKQQRKQKNKTDAAPTEMGQQQTAAGRATCCAISPDDKYLVTGCVDGVIRVWDFGSLTPVRELRGHRAAVKALRFRACAALELFSASADKSIKVWNLDEMGIMNTLYGHQDAVQQLDILQWPRLVSCGGMDKSCRLFKILEDSHLVFNGFVDCVSIDCVAMINEEHFVSGSVDGSLYVWSTTRKKPVCVRRRAHGTLHSSSSAARNQQSSSAANGDAATIPSTDATANTDPDPPGPNGGTKHVADGGEPRWISALATLAYTDLVASGSSDGQVRLWRVSQDYKRMDPMATFPLSGFINDLRFSHDGRWLACAVGQEHKDGRWWRMSGQDGVHNRVVIVPLLGTTVKSQKDEDDGDHHLKGRRASESTKTLVENGLGKSRIDLEQEEDGGEEEDQNSSSAE